MGLLDDAIREHLDLKRRRGADPAEVERDEREALGPVRRNQAPVTPESAREESVADETGSGTYDHAQDEDWSFGSEDDSPRSEDGEDRPDHVDDEFDDELEPLAPGSRSADDEPLGGPTVEYDVSGDVHREARGPADEPSKDDDVLEETPEFLQDTPDHDRLWFEQRPPRDFDFDG